VNLLRAVADNPNSWQLLMLPADETPLEVREHVSQGRQFALEQLRALLAWGSTRRTELVDLDLELAARALLAVGEQAVRLVLTEPAEVHPGALRRLRPRPPRHPFHLTSQAPAGVLLPELHNRQVFGRDFLPPVEFGNNTPLPASPAWAGRGTRSAESVHHLRSLGQAAPRTGTHTERMRYVCVE